MVARPAKKEAVKNLVENHRVAQSRACRVLDFPLSTFRYSSQKNEDEPLLERMKFWAEKRPRYGHPRIHAMLRRDGFAVNHKKTERLYYKVLRLNLRLKRRRKRFRSETRIPIEQPQSVNKVWSMDFISDQLASGQRIRGLTLIDVFNRYAHSLELAGSISGKYVVNILERVCAFEGYPEIITVDNGPEFISMALDKWACEHKVKLKFSRPGKPTDNPYIESFNGKVRDEFLNSHWFLNLQHARREAGIWLREYNEERPHSSLRMLSPEEFTRRYNQEKRLELIA